MPSGHSHGGVACDGNHGDEFVKTKRKKNKKSKSKRNKNGRKSKKVKQLPPICACKERGLPRHCCCHELCCGWNGCGKRHNIKHLPLFECMDKKKYRPGQRRRHSRCFYCYRNLGNWLTLLFTLIGLGGAIAALVIYLQPCKPNITYITSLQNRTVSNSSVIKTVNYNYDGANVLIMLDYSGSIRSEWQSEVDSAERILEYFKKNLHAQAPFHAGAIRWGSNANYLKTASGIEAKLGPNIAITEQALSHAKTLSPNEGTNFKGPMYWFYREVIERSTGAVDINPKNVHHNFAIFITDGESSDYMKRGSAKNPYTQGNTLDIPFKGDYSGGGADDGTKAGLCTPKGWPDSECQTANVIR